MKNENSIFLETVLKEFLRSHNFKKKGKTWYRDTKDCIHVISARKLQWGEKYFIDMGIFVKQLGNTTFPKEHECQVSGSLEQLYGHRYLKGYLDFEDRRFSNQERKIAIIIATAAAAIVVVSAVLSGGPASEKTAIDMAKQIERLCQGPLDSPD